MQRAIPILFAGLLLLNSCGVVDPTRAGHPAAAPLAMRDGSGSSGAATREPALAAVRPLATPEALDRLLGLDEAATEDLLGPPERQSERSPAKTWHYRSNRCVFSLHLYLDLHAQVFRTLAYEVTSHDASAAGHHHCLADFLARRRLAG